MSRIQKTVLPVGIKIVTEEMPDVESASIGIWINTGSRNESPAISGISHFIEHLLFKGTENRTALDISKEIESVGGVLNAFTSRESTCFYVKVLSKDLPLAIDLLSDIFMNSKFDQTEMEKERQVVLQEIKMVEDTPDDLIHDLFSERFWQGGQLGRSILGTAQTVSGIKRPDVIKYFGERYRSTEDVLITAAGGLKHEKVTRLLKSRLARFSGVKRNSAEAKPSSSPGVKLYKKELEQAHLCLGVPAPAQAAPQRYTAYLINTILGSGMSSRLFQEIREKRGLAYSVFSYLNLCRDTGSLVAYAGTSTKDFSNVVKLMLDEFAKLRAGKVTADEFRAAKEQLKGGMLLGFETSDARMSKLARDEVYFGRVVPVKEIIKDIDAVTLKQLVAMASDMLRPEKVTLVGLGNVTKRGLPDSLKG
ncbi:MAG: zinc protease [Deltaproteobacteria bacterium RIFCSPLOWO2_02_FULL_53_8]|nr:MAG: zinc protease [Deltaproteobacteria bacterium RIFCSPLOWO2_02_FULL_53_8]